MGIGVRRFGSVVASPCKGKCPWRTWWHQHAVPKRRKPIAQWRRATSRTVTTPIPLRKPKKLETFQFHKHEKFSDQMNSCQLLCWTARSVTCLHASGGTERYCRSPRLNIWTVHIPGIEFVSAVIGQLVHRCLCTKSHINYSSNAFRCSSTPSSGRPVCLLFLTHQITASTQWPHVIRSLFVTQTHIYEYRQRASEQWSVGKLVDKVVHKLADKSWHEYTA